MVASRPGAAGGVRVSVVVPARNAMATLPATLAALASQDLDDPFEVVVVDDGSTDGTADVARRAGAMLVTGPGQGPGAARNAGVRASHGDVLAFTDADCAPAPGWLREGLAAMARTGAGIVQGAVRPVGKAGPWDRTLQVRSEYGVYETANLFVGREWFRRVGGFVDWVNEPWRPAGPPDGPQPHFGEDALLAWRAKRLGSGSAFAPEAEVLHAVFRGSPHRWVRTRCRDGLFAELAALVPELRAQMFFGRVFLSRRSAAFDLATAALLGAVWRPWLLAGTLPYAVLLRREAAERQAHGRAVAAIMIGDAVGAAALVRASVRSRSVVL